MAQKNRRTTVAAGGTSILIIFVILCMTIFSALSLTSAEADYTLTKKAALSISTYYAADSRAEERLAEADLLFQKAVLGEETDKAAFLRDGLGQDFEVYSGEGEVGVIYAVEVNENAVIEADVAFDENTGERRIKKWKYVNTNEQDYDGQILDLWDGSFE